MNTEGEGKTEDELLVVPSNPANVSTTSPSPGGVEQSSAAQDVAQPVTDVEIEQGTTEEPLPEFDPKYRQALEGLMYLGKTTREFRWLGHRFVLATPTTDQLLELGQLHKPYVGTLSDIKAWQSLMVAAVVRSVDGQPLPVPLSDDVSALEAKFQYVKDHWYPWTIDKVYEQYLVLDGQVQEVLDAMGKA